MATEKGTGHVTPDFTAKDNKKEAEAAQKKVESLRKEEAKLVEELAEKRREISQQSALARTSIEPGFSNAAPTKDADTKDMSLDKSIKAGK